MPSQTSREPLRLPSPPSAMTPEILMLYLESLADQYEIEDQPILIQGRPVVNAVVVDGNVVLRTWCDELNANPPCPDHNPVQHRDGKPPWCPVCRLTQHWENPHESGR